MKCQSCDKLLTAITAVHEYPIYEGETGTWYKGVGEVAYTCGHCGEKLPTTIIGDILMQVDEL